VYCFDRGGGSASCGLVIFTDISKTTVGPDLIERESGGYLRRVQ